MWARLGGETPTLFGGSGVVSVAYPDTGAYTVVFDRNVTQCAVFASPVATTASDGISPKLGLGTAAVGPLAGNPNGVVVVRGSATGEYQPLPVLVAAIC